MIRLATIDDYNYISHALARKAVPYMSPTHAKADISRGQMYVKILNNKIVAQCSLVPEPLYNYTALKRMIIYRKENCGKHIADEFIQYFLALGLPLGATPWAENTKVKHILEKAGFTYQYTFLDNYEFYLFTKSS